MVCKPILKKDFVKSKVNKQLGGLKNKRVLVLRADRFGDLCVSRPFVIALAQKGALVDIWVKNTYFPLVDLLNQKFNQNIGKKQFHLKSWDFYFSYDWEVGKHLQKFLKFVFSGDWIRLIRLFWQYDMVIDLVGRRRFQIAMFFTKILKKFFFKGFETAAVYKSLTGRLSDSWLIRGDDKNIAIQYLKFLYDNPSQFITKLLSNKKDKIYKAQDILIHIGYGGESSRNWGSDNREKLINYLLEKKKKIVLVYTDAEPEGDLLKEKFENKIKIVKNPTFKQFFDLLNQIDFYIGVDSGPFHLADLLAKPGLVLFSRENEVVRGSFSKKIQVVKKFEGVCLNRSCGDNFCIRLIKLSDVISFLQSKGI